MGNTKQITREQQQAAAFQSLEKAVSGHKMMDMESHTLHAMREEAVFQTRSTSILRRLGLKRLPSQESNLLIRQVDEQLVLANEVLMAEKEHRKKRDQERDAAARAVTKRYTFTAKHPDPQGQLKADMKSARTELKPVAPNGPLEEYDSVNDFDSPIQGIFNTTGPTKRHFTKMLEARTKLAIYLERAPKELTAPNADLILAQKRDLYQKLDEAITTYYHAYGVDSETGQDVSGKIVKNARQHLALALENFQEAYYNQADDLADARLNRLRMDEAFQQQLKDDMAADLAQMRRDDLPMGTAARTESPEHRALLSVKNRIAEHPERYMAQRKMINQLVAEMTNCANTISGIDRQMAIAVRMLDAANDTGASAQTLRLTMAPERRYGRKKDMVQRQMKRLDSAINYLLTGQEPEEFNDALFLKKRCKVETPVYTTFVAAQATQGRIVRPQVARAAQPQAAETAQAVRTEQAAETAQEVRTDQAAETTQAAGVEQTVSMTTAIQAEEIVRTAETEQAEKTVEATETVQTEETAQAAAAVQVEETTQTTTPEQVAVALEEDIMKHMQGAEDALAEAERRAAEAGEGDATAQLRLKTVRALQAGSLSEKILAASYDMSYQYALADHQFREQNRSASDGGKTAKTETLLRNAGLSLLATPISSQGAEHYGEDRQSMMLQCRKRAGDFNKISKDIRNLYFALDEDYKEYLYAGFYNIPFWTASGDSVDYDRIGLLKNYLESASYRKLKAPLDPAMINEARELDAQLAHYLRRQEYDRRELSPEEYKPAAIKRLQKKFGYMQDSSPTYTIKDPVPEDLAGIQQEFAAELAMYEAGKADLEAFVQEHSEAFKAVLTPQERMANYAFMDLAAQKAKSMAARIFTFQHSPYYSILSAEEKQRFPDYYMYFRGIEEFAVLHSRVINSYDPNSAPVQWKESEIRGMSLSLSDYHDHYYRQCGGR